MFKHEGLLDEYWCVTHGDAAPQVFNNEKEAKIHYEKVCGDSWVNLAIITHVKVLDRYVSDKLRKQKA